MKNRVSGGGRNLSNGTKDGDVGASQRREQRRKRHRVRPQVSGVLLENVEDSSHIDHAAARPAFASATKMDRSDMALTAMS